MTGTDDLRDLKAKRSSIKGRLTSFEKYIEDLKSLTTITKLNIHETKTRLSRLEKLFEEYDLIQTNIEVKYDSSDNQNERESSESRFYKCIAEAHDIIERHNNSVEVDSHSSVSNVTIQNTHVKLPQIKIPTFSGDISNWLEFHDTFSSLIHGNESIASVNKYQYLKGALTGSAASVIASLEISSRNYEVAWKLLCDRYNDKRKLVFTHLKDLLDVPSTGENSLRTLADHIAKHLRALSSLGEKTENWDTLIIFLFVSKLDSYTSAKWEEHKGSITELPNLDDFYTFLRLRADVLEATGSSSKQIDTQQQSQHQPQLLHFKRLNKQQRSFVAATCDSDKNKEKCFLCNGEHLIYYCDKFLAMSPEDRFNVIIKRKHCINCLRSGHVAPQCKSSSCKLCKHKHNSLLHFDKSVNEKKELISSPISLSTNVTSQVLLSTAIVKVSCINSNNFTEARCLLDCGSQSSFCSNDLRNKLCAQTENISSVCVTGINSISFEALQRCNIRVQSLTNTFSTSVNVFVINDITSSLPSQRVDVSKIKLPKNLTFADQTYHIPSKIDLLLGADVFWEILCPEQIKLGPNLPILQNSKFGWLISGPVMCNNNHINQSNILCNFSQEIQTQLNKFWELEEVPHTPVLSQEEMECERHFQKHTRRLESGRFCVTLPLKTEPEKLGDSYYIALKRFESLERRFRRQPDVKTQYIAFINEYEALGHLSRCEKQEKAVYLPHHPVLKEQSESTKCRVVFDGSCKTKSGLSLNDILMVGPTLQDNIFSILIRLRQHAYILTGDIEKFYRQILIEPKQRYLQTILWRENDSEPIQYLQLNTVTYGTSSAPYLSTRCIVQLAMECKDPLISDIIRYDLYIDDLITGYSNENELCNIYERLTAELASAGFNLRKIKSNSIKLMNLISNKSNNHNSQGSLKISTLTNTLGIEWDPNSDSIIIAVEKSSKLLKQCSNILTKRIVLSVSSSIFDPLGLLSVCVITCKIILQKLWLEKLGWDDEIPQDISDKWQNVINNLKYIERFSIPRQAICVNPVKVDLHSFSDASMSAYAACVYARSIDAVGHITVRLLCAKTKVAPLKTTTIPRLELCGAVLAARLCKIVTKSLRCSIEKKYFWCDSKVVLGWLNTAPHILSTFVSHRVAEVNELCTSNSMWLYIPSSQNPADLASRGVYPQELPNLSLWWDGPTFLKDTSDQWFKQHNFESPIDLPEVKVHFSNIDTNPMSIIDFKRFSSFTKLRRMLAYIYRFLTMCRKGGKVSGPITAEELEASELKLAQLSQFECFSIYKNNFKALPALHNLTPTVDEQTGLIRVGGRLENSQYVFDKRHPIVLSSKHHFTELIMQYYHMKLMHAGPQLLLSVVREKYWPIGGRCLARRVCNNCVTCKRMKGAAAKQIMGNLPSVRLSPGFPFEITGIDYAGPFLILNRKGRGAKLTKCYLCVFICFKVKAVHLELVSDLTTEAFILALRRFMSRRGKPREIFCDNGTNFVGASREIAALVKNCSDQLSDLANEGIIFKFSPVYAPNFGGLYEAAVKSAKFHLKRVVGSAHFTFEELTTLFCQIEAILNSRPLLPMSSDPNDLAPLTPGHFLIGRPLTSLPSPDLQNANPRRLHRYALIEQARQHMWSRWSREYICELQQRTKWQTRFPNIEPNQLVLIKDESSPPMKWPLGRITTIYKGSDGACRVADIKTNKGILRRAINRICPLLDNH